jgi:hypothetical protein
MFSLLNGPERAFSRFLWGETDTKLAFRQAGTPAAHCQTPTKNGG